MTLPVILDEQQAAEFLKVSVRTLQNLRWNGKGGPQYVKVGGRVRYSQHELAAWFNARQRSSTTDSVATT